MKMSLSPTNCRTMPDASVLTITFGTPSGSARIAAVAMVVPADPPRPRTPDTSPRAYASRASLAAPAAAFVTASPRSALLPHRFDRRLRQLEDPLSRHIGRGRGGPERADIDEGHGDAPRRQERANEVGFAAFRVERGEEEDGRHQAVAHSLR